MARCGDFNKPFMKSPKVVWVKLYNSTLFNNSCGVENERLDAMRKKRKTIPIEADTDQMIHKQTWMWMVVRTSYS